MGRRARASGDLQPRDLRAAAGRRAPGHLVLARLARDARIDRAVVGRPGRRRRRDGDIVHDAPILAVAGLAAQGASNRTLELVAIIGLVVFAAIVVGFAIGLSSERLARRIGDRAAGLASRAKALIRKAPVKWNGATFVRFRVESIELIRRRWFFLTAATLAGHLTVFLVLVASVRAVGVPAAEVTIVEAFAAWTLARILGSIPITPGGVGFVELGLTGVLVAFGANEADAVAATLIYRFLTVVPTLIVGLMATATWKLGHRPATDRAQ